MAISVWPGREVYTHSGGGHWKLETEIRNQSSSHKCRGLISLARQKKVHPASRISRSNPHLSRSLTNLQPGTLHSLSNRTASGKSVPSLISMVPVLIVSDICGLLSVHTGALSRSNRHYHFAGPSTHLANRPLALPPTPPPPR